MKLKGAVKKARSSTKLISRRDLAWGKFLGGGGFGEVRQGRWKGVEVVVKRLKPGSQPNAEDVRARFDQEIQTLIALGRLGNPHIVPILATDVSDGKRWYAMPRAVCTLEDVVSALKHGLPVLSHDKKFTLISGAPDFLTVLRLFLEILAGVGEAHQHGIIHRDLKPPNILLYPDVNEFSAKVADFGLCREQGGDGPTRTGQGMGSPRYTAPEQWRNAKDCDARSDVFSLGAILHELLTGERLGTWERDGNSGIMLETISPKLGGAGNEIIRRCLADNPAERYPDVGSLREALWDGCDKLVKEQTPLSMQRRHEWARRFDLWATVKDCPKSDAVALQAVLKNEATESPRYFQQQFPWMHPGDIKNLIRHCPEGFGQLLKGFVVAIQADRQPPEFADQVGHFYCLALNHSQNAGKPCQTLLLQALLNLAHRNDRKSIAVMFRKRLGRKQDGHLAKEILGLAGKTVQSWFSKYQTHPAKTQLTQARLVQDEHGNTPLHQAALNGHMGEVPLDLLTVGNLLVKNHEGMTLLQLAVQSPAWGVSSPWRDWIQGLTPSLMQRDTATQQLCKDLGIVRVITLEL